MKIPIVESLCLVGVVSLIGVWVSNSVLPTSASAADKISAADRLQLPNLQPEGLQVQLGPQQFCSIGQPDFSTLTPAQQQVALGVVKLVPMVSGGKEEAARYCTSGSGINIGRQGVILTNAHVVQAVDSVSTSPGRMYVVRATGEIAEAVSVCVDTNKQSNTDFALIRLVEPLDLPVIPIAEANATVGEQVVALGFPLGRSGNRPTITIQKDSETLDVPELGGIQSLAGIDRLDTGLLPGTSGGGALNASGALVGITSMGKPKDKSQEPDPEKLAGSWMLNVNTIRGFLQEVITDPRYCRVGG